MKFMSSFQCLMPMGGNAVQFQGLSSVSPTTQSSLVLLDNDIDTRNSSSVTNKKTKTKTKTKMKKKKKKKQKKKMDEKVIKVFKPDGEINLYHKSIKVAEVMTEEYMVCRSDSFYIGQKIPPLSQHDRLQPGHTYFLLPAHLFHSVLSFVTIASFTASSSSSKQHDFMDDSNMTNMKMKAAFLKKAAASSCSPFDIQKTPSGTLRIRVSELFISQMMLDQAATNGKELVDLEAAASDLLCTTPQLHREYKQLVIGSRRGWKPKLEMIKEAPPKGKRKVKMLLSASINRVKRKIKNNDHLGNGITQISSSSSTSSLSLKKKKTIRLSSAYVKANKFSKTT